MILVGQHALISIRKIAHSPRKPKWKSKVRTVGTTCQASTTKWFLQAKGSHVCMMILCHLSGLISVPGLTFGIMARSGLTGPFWGSLLHTMRWMQHTHRVACDLLSDCKPRASIKPTYQGHSKPSPTSAPSTGCLLLLNCGWRTTELIFGFIWVISFVAIGLMYR
jgi:hypothetical protein